MPIVRPSTIDDLIAALAQDPHAQIVGSNSLPPLTDLSPEAPRITLLRLNKVVEHNPQSKTIRVQTGISFEALQQALAWHNQWIPMDPPAVGGRKAAQRTLGGILSTDSRGPLAMKNAWRTIAPWGTWIDPLGHRREGGISAAIGARGKNGVLAEITLRVSDRPADERLLVAFCHDASHAEAIRAAVIARPEVAYLQVIGQSTFAGNPLELPTRPCVVIIGTMGPSAASDVEAIRQLPEFAGVETLSQTAPQAGRLRLWMTSEPAAGFAFSVQCPQAAVAKLVVQLEAIASSAGAKCWAMGDAGIGQIRAAWTGPWSGSVEPIGQAVLALGGRCQLMWLSEALPPEERSGLLGHWQA